MSESPPSRIVSELRPRECGAGWNPLIDCLLDEIRAHLDCTPECPPVDIRQIKEKFGGLRFYFFGGDEYLRGLVRMAEAYSVHVCECCGARGGLEGMRTRCEAHKETRL